MMSSCYKYLWTICCISIFSNTVYAGNYDEYDEEILQGTVEMGQKGSIPYAGIYEYENLSISDNTTIFNSGTSQLVIRVKGMLKIGKNVVIRVRNGYSQYSSAPSTNVSNLTKNSILALDVGGSKYYSILPSTYGKGGNGGRGGGGGNGTVEYHYSGYGVISKIQGDGGNGGGGGGGGFGGGQGGYKGYKGYKATIFNPAVSGRDGRDGLEGASNGGRGGSAGASGGIGGGYKGLGGNASTSQYGGGGGGGGNSGIGNNGASVGAGMGGGGNGGGGGGGGYGGGVLVITADSIQIQGTGLHLFVSGQKGGEGGDAGYCYGMAGADGDNGFDGNGGLLIINTRSFPKNNTEIWNLNSSTYGELSNSSQPGHGVITGNPSMVLFNINEYLLPESSSSSEAPTSSSSSCNYCVSSSELESSSSLFISSSSSFELQLSSSEENISSSENFSSSSYNNSSSSYENPTVIFRENEGPILRHLSNSFYELNLSQSSNVQVKLYDLQGRYNYVIVDTFFHRGNNLIYLPLYIKRSTNYMVITTNKGSIVAR